MACTDEDLKRIKDNSYTPRKMVLALLARLEAAERLFAFRCVTDAIVACREAGSEYQVWRKAAAK